jgi:outer membrane protein OmpA-like peptidoglycan-associated protein
VLGYADPAGTRPGNLILSRQRAEQAAQFLVDAGIGRQSLSVRAGEEASGSVDAAHQRRAVVRANLTLPGWTARSAR